MKRSATEIGGSVNGSGHLTPPRRRLAAGRVGGSSMGDVDMGIDSPPSSGGFPGENTNSLSSVPSPSNVSRREGSGFGVGHRRSGSNGTGRLSFSQVSRSSSPGPGSMDGGMPSSPPSGSGSVGTGGTSSPVSKGKKFLGKHLRKH